MKKWYISVQLQTGQLGNINIKGTPSITGSIPDFCIAPAIVRPADSLTINRGGDNAATIAWTATGADAPNTSTLFNPSFTYTNAGPYTIQAVLTNVCGMKDTTFSFEIFNHPKPNAGTDFSVCQKGADVPLLGAPLGRVCSGRGVNTNNNILL